MFVVLLSLRLGYYIVFILLQMIIKNGPKRVPSFGSA